MRHPYDEAAGLPIPLKRGIADAFVVSQRRCQLPAGLLRDSTGSVRARRLERDHPPRTVVGPHESGETQSYYRVKGGNSIEVQQHHGSADRAMGPDARLLPTNYDDQVEAYTAGLSAPMSV